MTLNRLIIDIGTHEAQELRVLNGNRCYTSKIYLYWWYDWCKRQVKKLIRYNGLIEYGTGAFKISPASFGLKNHLKIIKQILNPTDYLQHTKILAIDPVASITTRFIKKIQTTFQVYFLPVAILPHQQTDDSKLTKFYIEKNSLSSSLDKSSTSRDLILCSALRTKKIVNSLKELQIIDQNTEIVLRMNCEGAEFGVIEDIVSEGHIPKTILGSLNDVRKKYGEEEAMKMNNFLEKNNIEFNYFKGSDPGTWIMAFEHLG